MNHVYFTALRASGPALVAEPVASDSAPRVNAVEPTGAFENPPNVTNKKFPGQPHVVLRQPGAIPRRR